MTVKQTCLLLTIYHVQQKFVASIITTVLFIGAGLIMLVQTTLIKTSKGQAGK